MKYYFGDKLKKIRIERNMTQEALAEFLGTSKQVISRYETNQRTPKITVTQEYAAKLQVPLLYLIDDNIHSVGEALRLDLTKNDDFSFTNEEKDIIKKYRSLTPEGKETVDTILDIQYKAVAPKIKNDTAG